ncbi:unnamed protein product [Protopolystoma xenopodis]|uniref:Uncharacterized protein n=1 Tax=Protopolystoma xenopodis TaxID=117903 RepID=A0A448WT35_9PLAT|nr:unnamed protein product [Protopolystoma xenopodis]
MPLIRVEDNWSQGVYHLTRIPCRSDVTKGVYCLQYDAHKIVSGLRDDTIKVWRRRQPPPPPSSLKVTSLLYGEACSVRRPCPQRSRGEPGQVNGLVEPFCEVADAPVAAALSSSSSHSRQLMGVSSRQRQRSSQHDVRKGNSEEEEEEEEEEVEEAGVEAGPDAEEVEDAAELACGEELVDLVDSPSRYSHQWQRRQPRQQRPRQHRQQRLDAGVVGQMNMPDFAQQPGGYGDGGIVDRNCNAAAAPESGADCGEGMMEIAADQQQQQAYPQAAAAEAAVAAGDSSAAAAANADTYECTQVSHIIRKF